jgi:hypothetical protein
MMDLPARPQGSSKRVKVVCSVLEQMAGEHLLLARHYGSVQARCSGLIAAQHAVIERLEAQVMRLRAAVIARDTAMAFGFPAHGD